MMLSNDEEKFSISSFSPRVDRDRVLLRCLLPQDMGYTECVTPNISVYVRPIGIGV